MPRRIRRHNHIVPREEEEENPLMKALARDQSAAEIRENIWKTNTHYGCGIFFAANFYNLTAYCFPPCLHKAGEAFTRTFFSLVFAILTIWIRHVKNGYDHLREIDVCNCDSCKGQAYSVKTVEQIQWKIEKANSAVKRMKKYFVTGFIFFLVFVIPGYFIFSSNIIYDQCANQDAVKFI